MFCEQLKKLRKEKECTQEMLANAIGVAKSTISMYENGNREPDFETLEAIADFFNVSVSRLVSKPDTDEVSEYLEELRSREEMRMLFSVTKGATKEEIQQAVKIIEALRKND